ncbi:MAG TPA: replicative DNA helicase [Candidatus Onthocola stercorigallinarum]|nr:replicative DNA helicase [Candidatus Onthocola stercorigallinarum]
MARKMPQNLEAEMSVLGVAFLNAQDVNKIVEEVTADMFFDERNRIIFNAIKNLHDSKTPIDITTIKDELDKDKKLNTVGLDYLTDVIDSVVTTANLDFYIKIIKDYAIRRNLIETATEIINTTYEDENITTLLDTAEKNILNVVRARSAGSFMPIQEVLRNAQAKLEELAKNKRTITGLETGFPDFDKITTGLHGGEMIILAARPGMGKTALALNMASFAAMHTKKAVAIFNLEMSAEMLVNRMIASVGQIDSYKLQTGNMLEKDWQRYNEALSQLSETNIFIEDNVSVTAQDIRAKCRRLANSETGLGLVVIDYLQLINSGSRRVESRQVEVSEISRALKTMAVELDVPVIALAQLSRSAEKRESNQPMLSDLRESGSLEQDADMVLFINRKDYYEKAKDFNNKIVPAELIIAKHRKGGLGTVNLLFELNMLSFKSVLKVNGDEQ